MSDSPAFPIVIGEQPLNSRDLLRVALDSFEGAPVIDVRKFYRDGDGTAKPMRKGLTLALGRLPMLAEMVGAALNQARAAGLLQNDGEAR